MWECLQGGWWPSNVDLRVKISEYLWKFIQVNGECQCRLEDREIRKVGKDLGWERELEYGNVFGRQRPWKWGHEFWCGEGGSVSGMGEKQHSYMVMHKESTKLHLVSFQLV